VSEKGQIPFFKGSDKAKVMELSLTKNKIGDEEDCDMGVEKKEKEISEHATTIDELTTTIDELLPN